MKILSQHLLKVTGFTRPVLGPENREGSSASSAFRAPRLWKARTVPVQCDESFVRHESDVLQAWGWGREDSRKSGDWVTSWRVNKIWPPDDRVKSIPGLENSKGSGRRENRRSGICRNSACPNFSIALRWGKEKGWG